jgi:hypothetical protein
LAPFAFSHIAFGERDNPRELAMSRRIRVRGDQRKELELERLAHALLRAAREAAQREEAKAVAEVEVRRDA